MPSRGAFSRSVSPRFFRPEPADDVRFSAVWPTVEAALLIVLPTDDAACFALSIASDARSCAFSVACPMVLRTSSLARVVVVLAMTSASELRPGATHATAVPQPLGHPLGAWVLPGLLFRGK